MPDLNRDTDKLSTIVGSMGIGLWRWISDKSSWDEQPLKITSLAPLLSYEEFLQMIHVDDRESTAELIEKSMSSGIAPKIECRILRPDGKISWVSSKAEPVKDDEGNVVGLIGCIIDITERRKSESALRESEARWQFALEGAGDGLWDWNAQTNEVFFSLQWKAMLGYTADEIQGSLDEWDKRVHPDDKERVYVDLEKHLAGETPFYINEHRALCKDGTYKWILDRGKVISWTVDGKPLRVIGTHTDISEHKQVEEELRKSKQLLNDTGRMAKIGGWEFDSSTQEFTWTDEVYRIHEVSMDYIPSVTEALDFYAPQSAPVITEAFQRALDYGESYDLELQLITAKKNLIWVRAIGKATLQNGKVIRVSGVFQDITERKRAEDAHHLAHHDPLTKLPNRLLFDIRMEHSLELAHRERCLVGVMFLDLDCFKQINDGLGHAMGDKVLHSVAKRLIAQVREEDTVARIAGDEFSVIVGQINDPQDVAHVAEKILSSFDAPFQLDGLELRVTASIGISLYPNDGKDVATLMKNADAAMYRAKESGKNRYNFYTFGLSQASQERLRLETDLRTALQRSEFSAYYQPQYSLTSGQLVGAEALLRWHHPELGLLSPTQFITIAEKIGLIIPLGEWILDKACTQTKAWQDDGHKIDRIGVNVSVQQLHRSDFVQMVLKILEKTKLDPHCLELEITESTLMKEAEVVISTLRQLQKLGVGLAIDDFGTGYSSLSYLKNLPINKLKIDRSFIQDIPRDFNGEAIARAIIALSKSLQLMVVAEGMETEEQKTFVSLEGCDEVQGYYYSRPLPEKDFGELLGNLL